MAILDKAADSMDICQLPLCHAEAKAFELYKMSSQG